MEKYLTKQQIQELVTNAPTSVSTEEIINGLVGRGYTLEGFNEPQTPEKKPIAEKILDFTGGKELAQGLAQVIANPAIAKQQEETQKQQIEIQGNLIKAIKAKRATGEDTTKLEKALADLSMQISDTGEQTGELLNQEGLTTKQILGDALQLGTTLATVGGLQGAGAKAQGLLGKVGMTKSAPSLVSNLATKVAGEGVGVLAGAGKGALTGLASGAVVGASTGASQGLQADKSAIDILKDTGKGALVGGVSGGILGGIIGGVSGGIRGAKIKKSEAYLDAVTPNTKDLTPTEYEKLLNQGKITPKTKTSPAKYVLSDGEKEIAKKYKSIFTNDPVKNTERIADEISKKDTEVGQFLKKNNGIFNKGELKNSLTLKLENIDDLTVDEKRLAKLKKATIDNFMKGLDKNDMETLWKSRKEFDRTIEKAFSGSPTLQNTIKKEFRNGIQDFIAERTPDNTYKGFMKDMSQLFNLKDVVNTKAVKEKGLNALQVWIKRNPTKAKVIGWTAGTGVVGTVGASVINN